MKIKIGLGVLVLLAGFLGFVAVQPEDYVISRDILINAPVEKIFPYLNDSRMANQWAPWTEIDPQAKMEYSGPEAGVGAQTSWSGEGQLGTGSATIVESVLNQRIAIKLQYVKPMNMTQDAEYLMQSVGNQTQVTWKVKGKNSFLGRAICVFMDMDQVVGGMFEKGLSNLKKLTET